MKPLYLSDPKRKCPSCSGEKRRRGDCADCHGTGLAPMPLGGFWAPSAGFLVGGGPSLRRERYRLLAERGVVSLGVNNVAAFAPVRAWTFHDPQVKFHHALFFDPAVITFAPTPKLKKCVRVRLPDGSWRMTNIKVGQCPGTVGYSRRTVFWPETFFDDWFAHVGFGGKNKQDDQPFRRIATIFCGLRLLVNMGVRRVYLAGVDLTRDSKDEGGAYCFNERGSGGVRMLEKENEMFHMLVPVMKREGIEVYNTSPESRCDAFPYVPFERAIEDCRGAVPPEPYDLSGWYSKRSVKEMRAAGLPPLSWAEVVEMQR